MLGHSFNLEAGAVSRASFAVFYEKLARAHALGADVTINYTVAPEWHQEVLCIHTARV